jgi:uncharacterized protein YeaO (DUF488 family)
VLKQASVSDIKSGKISRDDGHIVITMRRYPRFVRRELRDEYVAAMAPPRKLFEDWLSNKRRTGDHHRAFDRVRYEERYDLPEEGWEALERLSKLSRKQDVYLVCQCQVGQRCHREMLLMLAKQKFKARAENPRNDYPTFRKRMGLKRPA